MITLDRTVIERLVRDDQAGALAVEVRIDVGQRIAPDHTQRIGGFLRVGVAQCHCEEQSDEANWDEIASLCSQ